MHRTRPLSAALRRTVKRENGGGAERWILQLFTSFYGELTPVKGQLSIFRAREG
jgi:hypothetical protein